MVILALVAAVALVFAWWGHKDKGTDQWGRHP
jgi:hypothetical protein